MVDAFGKNGNFSLKFINKLHDFKTFVYETLGMTILRIARLPRYVMGDDVVIAGDNIPKGYGIIGDYEQI